MSTTDKDATTLEPPVGTGAEQHGFTDAVDLFTAASDGDAAKLREVLDRSGDTLVWAQSEPDGLSPLMYAAANAHTECVRVLLERGAPWNQLDKNGRCAGDHARIEGHAAVHEELLSHACRAELLLSAMAAVAGTSRVGHPEEENGVSNKTKKEEDFLSRPLHYSEDGQQLLDANNDGVMMGWERPLMRKHAQVCPEQASAVLNIGFGLGIIDEYLQERRPEKHVIVEAHPDVHRHMLATGWGERVGVDIRFGKWQDVLPQLVAEGLQFDYIFFDTFGEEYEQMREFHEQLLSLLAMPNGIYSFFNGLAASTSRFFHDVYCVLVDMELRDMGFRPIEYVDVPIDPSDPILWEGVRRKYWVLDTYHLPICRLDL